MRDNGCTLVLGGEGAHPKWKLRENMLDSAARQKGNTGSPREQSQNEIRPHVLLIQTQFREGPNPITAAVTTINTVLDRCRFTSPEPSAPPGLERSTSAPVGGGAPVSSLPFPTSSSSSTPEPTPPLPSRASTNPQQARERGAEARVEVQPWLLKLQREEAERAAAATQIVNFI